MQKNSVVKVSVASIIIASLCIAAYLAALVFAGVRIYSNIDQRSKTAYDEFMSLTEQVKEAGRYSFMDERFVRVVEDALVSTETLEGVIIYSPNGDYSFEKVPGQVIATFNNTPRFKPRFDLSKQWLNMSLDISYFRNVTIEAKAFAFNYQYVSDTLKQTLFFVLAALVLAFFALLVESLIDKPGTAQPVNVPKTNNAPQIREPATKMESTPKPEPLPVQEQDFQYAHNAPKGLYTDRGHIGWEEYLHERLESELQRCASNEQDLVLFDVEFKDSCFAYNGFYLRLAEEAVSFFTLRDLIFEKGERGMTIIYPNIDIDVGLAKAEEFHQHCLEKFPDVLTAKTDLCMGLSSRSGRIIEAGRLAFEAGEAIGKALTDPLSPIVAFKSDPEKYRAFIAARGKR